MFSTCSSETFAEWNKVFKLLEFSNAESSNFYAFQDITKILNLYFPGRCTSCAAACPKQNTDNTEFLAWAKEHKGFTVGIKALGNANTIAPAVQKGNKELLNWINDEMNSLAKENFFHKDFQGTLPPVYGNDVSPDSPVVEGGKVN